MKHKIVFSRISGFGNIENLIIATFASEIEGKSSIDILTNAVTQWIKETENGMNMWEYSSCDLNIGDLSCSDINGDEFSKWGVSNLDFQSDFEFCTFDTILCDDPELERE